MIFSTCQFLPILALYIFGVTILNFCTSMVYIMGLLACSLCSLSVTATILAFSSVSVFCFFGRKRCILENLLIALLILYRCCLYYRI